MIFKIIKKIEKIINYNFTNKIISNNNNKW